MRDSGGRYRYSSGSAAVSGLWTLPGYFSSGRSEVTSLAPSWSV